MPSKTTQEIIQGCQRKDPLCQKALVVQYSPMLMAVSYRYMKDRVTAKDVLQEALIRILKAIPQYRQSGSFEGWMKKIVINTALSYFDKSCFKKETSREPALLPQSTVAPEVYQQLAVEELMHIINQLPEHYRMVFNLVAIEGYSHREVAQLLNIQESTSRSHLARARKQLLQLLNCQGQKKIRI